MADTTATALSPHPPPPPGWAPAAPDISGRPGRYGTWSVVAGVVGLVFANIVVGPVAVVLGLSGRVDASRQGLPVPRRATAGIVLGVLDVVVFVVFVALTVDFTTFASFG